jgi:hypothetical protein
MTKNNFMLKLLILDSQLFLLQQNRNYILDAEQRVILHQRYLIRMDIHKNAIFLVLDL